MIGSIQSVACSVCGEVIVGNTTYSLTQLMNYHQEFTCHNLFNLDSTNNQNKKIGGNSMPNVEDSFLPKDAASMPKFAPFIKAADIGSKLGAYVDAVIDSPHRTITRDDGTESAIVDIRVGGAEGEKRTLGLNKRNMAAVVAKHGKDSDQWVGQVITLVRTEANNPQTMQQVPSIKVE